MNFKIVCPVFETHTLQVESTMTVSSVTCSPIPPFVSFLITVISYCTVVWCLHNHMLCCGHHSSRRPSANAKHFEPKQNGVVHTSLLLGDGNSWIKNGELQTSSLLLGDGSSWIKNEVLQTSSSLLLGNSSGWIKYGVL